ncbi:MAG: hypothetical protein KZQ79_15935, partial [Candidatus Thiodiazotropha sp. (ex Lucinoma borealis)]|nr:hypothetical protein [Candidatus Thiodiazotropha sp. (ex Lucinoma borealis)]
KYCCIMGVCWVDFWALAIGLLNLESAVEHGFEGNPGVSSKASFVVNGYSLNKNDNAAGCVGIFLKCV